MPIVPNFYYSRFTFLKRIIHHRVLSNENQKNLSKQKFFFLKASGPVAKDQCKIDFMGF